MVDHPTRRQAERILPARLLSRRSIWRGEHLRLPIWMTKAFSEEPRCPRMVKSWAWPEDSTLLIDLLPRDAIVIGHPSFGGLPILVPDVADRLIGEELLTAQASGQFAHDLPVASGLPRGSAARLILITRPSRLVVVPSSSHQTVPGRTTSASSAVSDMKKSTTISGSTFSNARFTTWISGSETMRFEHATRQLLISPSAMR